MDIMKERSIIGMILIFLLISTHVFAYDAEIDGLRYDWQNRHNSYGQEIISLVGYNSSKINEDLIIPNTLRWVSNDSRNRTQCVVDAVGARAFQNCSKLKSVNFNFVRTVGQSSFENCSSLKTIYFSYISYIYSQAFKGCSSLTEIHINLDTPPSVYEDSFDEEIYKNATLFVPEGKIDVYRANDIWNKFEKISDGTTNESFTLEITSVGNGSASYNGTSIRGKTSTFTVNEGSSATISFSPDKGYRIKSVKVNNTDVTSSLSNNLYTIQNIANNTSIEVVFDAIPTIISFADANVKAICVKNWDTDGDGELSESEAAAVTYLGGAFYENAAITSFEELSYFVGLEDLSSAFRNCSNLKKVVIPNSVKIIGKWAFQNCSGLTGTLVIPASVTTIGESAFENCSGFTGFLTFPTSVTFIGKRAFVGCNGFSGLTIPNSVTTIGDYAFYECSGFSGSLTIPNSVTSIGWHAFNGCSGLTGSLTIPNSVTSIGNGAFYGCSGLAGSLTIPNSVTSIGDHAFFGCSNINLVISLI